MLQDYDNSMIKAPFRLAADVTLAILFITVLLCGCQTMDIAKSGSKGINYGVGDNTIGESCRLVSAEPEAGLPPEVSVYQIFCGKWEQPSASVYRIKATKKPLEQANEGWWRSHLDTTFNCNTPLQTKILDNIPAVALDCTFRAGGWPNQALATQIGDETFLVDSLPATYPVVERSIGILSGKLTPHQASENGTLSSEIQRLEARLTGTAYSAGDLQRYKDLLRLAQYYNFQGLFPEAEERYREALKIHQNVLPDDRGGLGYLYTHIALELSNQEQFREADAMFDEVDKLLQYSLEPSDRATLVSYRAIHLANQRHDNEALNLARKASLLRRDLAQDYGYSFPAAPGNTIPKETFEFAAFTPKGETTGSPLITRGTTSVGDLVQSQSVEAAMLIEVGKLDEADRVLTEAFAILTREATAPRRWLPKILVQKARVAELRGDLANAEHLLIEAINNQQALFSKSRTEGLAYLSLGRVYTNQGRISEALDAFHSGFAIIAERGGGLFFEDALPYFKAGLIQAKNNPSERDAIHAEMFEMAQLIRGPVTAVWMARTIARLASGDQEVSILIRDLEAARHKRDQLREQLTLAQADQNTLAPQIEALKHDWQSTNDTIAGLERQVQAAAPRYNQLIDTPVSAKDVMSVLQPDEAIVQILLGTESSFGFLIEPSHIEVYEIELTEQQAKAGVSKLRAAFEITDSLPVFPVADSYELYVKLFSPIAERLAKVKHIITVPTGPLLSLPFGLFVTNPPPEITDRDYTQVAWLAKQHALTLTPSVQSFVNLRQTKSSSKAKHSLIGFGDFIPHSDPDTLLSLLGMPESCRDQAVLIANLSTLPGTGEEIRSVAKAIGNDDNTLYLGNNFTEEAVKHADLADYRIVYFATHGLLPYKLQCLSQPALAVSTTIQDASKDDGLLMTEEVIKELKLDADLVVLSACDTGGPGQETGGEALSGLARAFFYAGARSLLVSHWEVPDKPTMRLLTGTFNRLAPQDLSLAEALQKSQIDMMEYRPLSHPLAWAGFTIVGDGGEHLSRMSSPTTLTAR